MKHVLVFSLFSLLAVGCANTTKKSDTKAAKAEAAKKENAKASTRSTECKSGTDVRTIEIKETDNNMFEVVYTKFGEAKSIASGGREHSEGIRERVKGNLENAGFTCN